MAKKRELTDLESCVLGVIWRDGPITAYEVAAFFASSLSPYWSGSAGAIYPVVLRLRKRRLLKTTRGGPRRTLLAATEKGAAVLRAWLTPPLDAEAGAPSFDPMRTMVYFLEVLPPPERKRFLDDAARVVNDGIAATKQQRAADAEAGRASEALGQLGAIFELQARLRWLRAVRRQLKL